MAIHIMCSLLLLWFPYSINYEVFSVNFVWRNILTVIKKDCGFVEMLCVSVCVCVCVCVFDIIVLEKYCG